MNKILVFWIVSSIVLFLLSLVYFQQNLHRKNALFAWWLCLGVSMQLLSAYGIVLSFPAWMYRLWPLADVLSISLALGVLASAFVHRSCAVNQIILYGLGAMMALNLTSRLAGNNLGAAVECWLQNIVFLGPALFLLLAFSGIRADGLPLRIGSMLRGTSAECVVSRGIALNGLEGRTGCRAA